MKPTRAIAALVFVLVACDPVSDPPSVQGRSAEPARTPDRDLSFPGGGQILFLASRGPIYAWRGVGVVEPDGTVRHFPRQRHTFPYWDPAAPDRLLMLPFGSDPTTRSFEIVGDSLVPVGSWPTTEVWTLPSLDGSLLAFTPVDRSGRPRRRILRLVDRSSGEVRSVPSLGLVPLAWMPGRELLGAPWEGGGLVRWDPWGRIATPFGPRLLSEVVWDPRGRRYAGVAASAALDTQSEIVIGRRDGSVTDRVPVGRRWVGMPTWSPDGGRIAFVVRGPGRRGHRRATMHVYDVDLGIDRVVADRVSDPRWVSWSPDGEWLLLDDWTRDRWLFVAAAGGVRLPYPWLGHFPRWCCPSSPSATTPIPVS